MKLTVTQWTLVQETLEKTEPVASKWINAHIEDRTFGRRWTAEVGIAFHGNDKKIVEDAIAATDLSIRLRNV